ncbi:MAG: Nif3-like dinuclear metal center hexameric protein [Planctomycetes bacterium]|nr:Nif3-like dinuclear metal center hexameric protein [Planctomycetota bacterium]
MKSLSLQTVQTALLTLAPLQFAEEWDNVGLLVEPTNPRPVRRLMLTIDLTEPVLDEAIARKTDMIVAYHPPIFEPVKRLVAALPKSRLLVRLLEAGIAVYSPHTALDAAPGGVNDFLADGLGDGDRHPIQPAAPITHHQTHKVVVFVPTEHLHKVREAMASAGAGHVGHYDHCSFSLPGMGTFRGDETTNPVIGAPGQLESVEEVRLEMVSDQCDLAHVAQAILQTHPYEEPAWEIHPLTPRPRVGIGPGRAVTLDRPISIDALVTRIKKHLGLKHVRLARCERHRRRGHAVREIKLCAGAGGSLLKGQGGDAYLTGEMRHHDILAANAAGISVILTDHTNTERPYLPVLKANLHKLLGKSVRIDISKIDADPLVIV